MGAKPNFPLLLDPQTTVLNTFPAPMTEEFLSRSREICFPSFDFINLVILPTPKTSPHPLEAGRSMGYFFFLYSEAALPEVTFTAPTTYLNKKEREENTS